MGRWVAVASAVVLLLSGCATDGGDRPGLADSPSPTVALSPSGEGSPTTDDSPSPRPSPTSGPSANAEPSPPRPLVWGDPQLLADDSPLLARATAVSGPGGLVGHLTGPWDPDDGPAGRLLWSSDGTSWETVLERDGVEIVDLLAGGDGYVVIGTRHLPPGDADRRLAPWAAWSADGLTWREVDVPLPGVAGDTTTSSDGPRVTGWWFQELVAAPAGFVALGHGATAGAVNVLWTSVDGTAWELRPGDPFGGEASVRGMVRGGDRYVAHGNAESPGDAPGPLLAWHSDDALTWSRAVGHESFEGAFGEGPLVAGVVAFGDGFVMVGAGVVDPPMAWRSVDGSAWEAPVTLPSLGDVSASVSAVAASGGRILAAGREIEDGAGFDPGIQYPGLWTSTDGVTWEQVPPEELRGGLGHDGVSIGALTPLDDGWLALGQVWDYPDEVPTALAWTGR